MTAEQAPGIPWHDHEWFEQTTIGATERTFFCAFDPIYRRESGMSPRIPGSTTRCPAVKTGPIPEPLLDGLRVSDVSGNFLRYAENGSLRLPGGQVELADRTPEDCRVEYIRGGKILAVGYLD